ncbi:hypothetical protein HB816_08630 [Listeria booriae]|uniref:hypothetical protein n=1 Tax=Listeria booriae TaxID=1552123 RepID=UPI001625DA94|nr:hypothetical protein [Listeria booriae]MBC1230507.1 hypothetical protein [Listeria booriae]
MKTSEFKKAVEALGYKVWLEGTSEKYFSINNGKGTVAFVKADKLVGIDTTFGRFERLSDAGKQSLGTLIFEYASTPLDEREEPKKFRIKCPITGQFLNRSKWEDDSFSWRGNSFETPEYQPQFTRQDIEEYEFPMENLIEEEVTE